MKSFLHCLLLLTSINAFGNVWQPSKNHQQIPIWPNDKIPGPVSTLKAEYVTTKSKPLIAGKPLQVIWNVSHPTMTVYSPTAQSRQNWCDRIFCRRIYGG